MASLLAFSLGIPEMLIILFAILLLFGATKIPKLARSMGQSVGEFKKGLKEGNEPEAPGGSAGDTTK